MNSFTKKCLMVAAVAALGIIGSVMNPRGGGPLVGSATAKDVTDVNIVSPLPVPVYNIDSIGRIPYQKVANMSGQCGGQTSCVFSFGAVPAGHRLVVQHITGIGQFTAIPTKVSILALNTQGQPILQFFPPINGASSAFDQNTLFYVDAGFQPFVTMAAGPDTFAGSNLSQNITLTGYLLDCTVANCAPIVQ
jgi:hypothetical protein